jgi:hypothetical protein
MPAKLPVKNSLAISVLDKLFDPALSELMMSRMRDW